jgi:hypothetical protein
MYFKDPWLNYLKIHEEDWSLLYYRKDCQAYNWDTRLKELLRESPEDSFGDGIKTSNGVFKVS